MLIVNADDWGRSRTATDNSLTCFRSGRITSVSAMVFMADSARGAKLANDAGVDTGLHANFSEEFNSNGVPPEVRQAQDRIRRFLRSNRYALLLYNPFLRREFALVFRAQWDEFARLFGSPPSRIDGHQHMHLATNLLVQNLLPAGTRVRRSFSFRPGQKSVINRAYRRVVDWRLSRRHRLTDSFFALSSNLEPARLQAIVTLSRAANVELMTHPWNPREFDWLMSPAWLEMAGDVMAAVAADLRPPAPIPSPVVSSSSSKHGHEFC
jgi:predicted glycoside hydrolase/deacetylase ChbG (UPF0249 family)